MSWVLLENEVGLLGGRSDWCRRIQAEVSSDERRQKNNNFVVNSLDFCLGASF